MGNSYDVIYDIETYSNLFSLVAVEPAAKKMFVFEISDRKDDGKRLRAYLGKLYRGKARMVGFNNLGFDYPVIHEWLNNRQGMTARQIYDYVQELFESSKDNRFGNQVPAEKQWIKQVDLFKIWHYDNKAKSTSLKMLEYNMRSENIKDLPYHPSTTLTSEQMDEVIAYNKHDVLETLKFYEHSAKALELRKALSEKFGVDFTNHNDTKIGKDYFVQKLEDAIPNACYKVVNGRRIVKQTKRKKINLADVVFEYIQPERPEFKAVVNWIKAQTITETKGVFSDIEEHKLGELAKYAKLVTKKKKLAGEPDEAELKRLKKERPLSWIEPVQLKSGKISYYWKWNIAESLNVVIDGLEYVYGLGGIHASVEKEIFESNDEWVIMDIDVSSMYPNIFIANNVYPEHLGIDFCKIYKDVYNERKQYKKGSPENMALKLALNGTYGATNDQYSPFYDPKATMTITVNGQLMLSCLAEKLLEVPELRMIQLNTDGLTYYCKRSTIDKIQQIIKEWESVTMLEMESVTYSKMIIANVNNYIAVYEGTDKVKLNGRYEYRRFDEYGDPILGWHQNQSALVIKQAAVDYLVSGKPIEKTIKQHKDLYDFMLRTKVPRSSRLVTVDAAGTVYPEQNICRYYVSNNGKSLFKIMPPLEGKEDERWFAIEKGNLVKVCNNMKSYSGDINYDYYIEQAHKLASFDEVDEETE